MTARVDANDNYTANATSVEFTVVGFNATIEITQVANTTYTVGTGINITVSSNSSAPVNVTINGVEYSVGANGVVLDNVTLAPGHYIVTARVDANDNYTANATSVEFDVVKTNSVISNIAVPTGDIPVGQNVTVNVTMGNVESGKLLIEIGGHNYTVDIVDYVANLTVALPAGTYNATAYFLGDGKYNATHLANTTEFSVVKTNAVISSVIVPTATIDAGLNATIRVIMQNIQSGKVLIEVNNHNYTVDIVDYEAELNVTLPVGRYNATAYYLEDEKYNAASLANLTNEIVVVGKLDPVIIITVHGDIHYVGENVTITATSYDGADITILVNGTPLIDGKYLVPEVGTYNVTASTPDTVNYGPGWNTTQFNVVKKVPTISVNVDGGNHYVGGYVGISYSTDSDGVVTVKVGDDTVPNGRYYPSNIGTYTVVVSVAESDKYYAGSSSATFKVIKQTPGINVQVNTPVNAGDKVTIKVTGPSDVVGYAGVVVGGKEYMVRLTGGVGTVEIPGLAGDSYNVAATYLENDKYGSATKSATLVVNKVNPTIDVKFNNITTDETPVFDVTLPNDATGTITIRVGSYVDTVRITGGLNKVAIPKLAAGEYAVSVTYNGDGKYNLITSPNAKLKVSGSSSGITLSVKDLNNGTVIVSLPDSSAEGTVEIDVAGETFTATVENGVAVVTLNNVTPGRYDATVKYSDGYGSKAEMETIINIFKYDSPMTVSVTDLGDAGSKSITVTLPEGATGTVTVEVDGKTQTKAVIAGSATFNIEGLTEGVKTAIITYAGDSNFAENYTTARFTVSKVVPVMTVNSSTIEDFVILTAKLPSDATGQVLFDIGGVGYYANVANGVATISVPNLSGATKATVTYTGDDKYGVTSSKVNIDVEKVEAHVYVNAKDIQVGDVEDIVITVPVDATGSVLVVVDEVSYTADITDGVAYISISGLEKGTYNIGAIYYGDAKYKLSTNSSVFFNVGASIITEIVVRGYNSPYDYYATFLDENDNPLAYTTVQFIAGGETYDVTTDEEGIAYLPGGILAAGNHTIISVNPVTNYETYGTAVIVARLQENKDVVMDFYDGQDYRVRVYGDDGEPVGAGKVVTMVITGSWGIVTYNVTTNDEGYAIRTIQLSPGTYTISAEYAGYKVINSIDVKSTLSAKAMTVKKSAKTTTYSATLKWSNGKPISGKNLKFTFNGKTYYAKTNTKGVASIKITSGMVKNLKVGKSYKMKVTYETSGSYKSSEYVTNKIKIAK